MTIQERLNGLFDKRAAHDSLNPNVPNAELWIKENIIEANEQTAENNLTALENADAIIKANEETRMERKALKSDGSINEKASNEVMKLINGIGRNMTKQQIAQLKVNHGAAIQLLTGSREPEEFKLYIESIDADSDPVITPQIKKYILDELKENGIV